MKEQARKKRIPFTRPGGAYRFTAEHFAEIVRLFEERPENGVGGPDVGRRKSRRKEPRPTEAASGTPLVARLPRRMRQAQCVTAA
ncbi:DNA-binding protein [Streptomyces luteolus]|uniref:DNA-binding protein n=1 Tax=Streptomyces luteolus TaxID=3043615 RepID=UPI0038D0890C